MVAKEAEFEGEVFADGEHTWTLATLTFSMVFIAFLHRLLRYHPTFAQFLQDESICLIVP
jgi:hypothetical protein